PRAVGGARRRAGARGHHGRARAARAHGTGGAEGRWLASTLRCGGEARTWGRTGGADRGGGRGGGQGAGGRSTGGNRRRAFFTRRRPRRTLANVDLTDLSGLPRLPEQMSDAVSRFASYLDAQRGHSAHTRRAYVADVTDLLRYAMRHGTTRLDEIDLALLRGWLASQSERGLARSTLARRGASARAFLRWAHRIGLVPVDPSARLASPKVPRTLPTVRDADAASRLLDGARAAADSADEAARPAALRSWVAAELLYGAGIRVGELVSVDVGQVDPRDRLVRV